MGSVKHRPRHEPLVDPMHFGNQLISVRNKAQRPDMDHAVLIRVWPSAASPPPSTIPKPYARNQAQKAHRERDSRITVYHGAEVPLRA